ncbi:hypothetical protein [Aeromonas veronii]|uniref:hypothetical protein n=1 Tax=Aeromonas veronii TaxID=654 RepID=UPI00331021EA|nr:hypothetical protein [Aeromonas veronii]
MKSAWHDPVGEWSVIFADHCPGCQRDNFLYLVVLTVNYQCQMTAFKEDGLAAARYVLPGILSIDGDPISWRSLAARRASFR